MRCPACEGALRELSSVAPGARGCDACGGFWLDHGLLSSIAPPISRRPEAVPAPLRRAGSDVRRCPSCHADLVSVEVAGPTPVALDRCESHGTWFDAHDLTAITRSDLAARIARALVADSARIEAGERAVSLAAIEMLRRRGAGFLDYVRPAGNPARVTLGVGASVFHGGVATVSAQGREVLVGPVSARTWPTILAVVGALWIGVLVIPLLDAPFVVGVAVEAFFCLLFGALVIGSYVVARAARKKSLVIDAVSRSLVEMNGARAVLRVPARLVRTVRVQLYADAGYADRFDVLCTLGFAELWVMQTSDREWASSVAQTVARALGVRLDPEMQRKGG